jgi:hypothetical protein
MGAGAVLFSDGDLMYLLKSTLPGVFSNTGSKPTLGFTGLFT